MGLSPYNGGFYSSHRAGWKLSKRKFIDGTQIHEGSGNVYRDLDYSDADEMLVKAQLVAKISVVFA